MRRTDKVRRPAFRRNHIAKIRISAKLRTVSRGGFTLIEFFVASLIAVVLMVVLAGLLRAVWQQNAIANQTLAKHLPTRMLAEQLRRDVINARALATAPGSIRLGGFASTTETTGLATLRPAEVVYQVVGSPNERRLLRSEFELDSPLGVAKSELLWVGAGAIDVVYSDELVQSRQPLRYRGMLPMPRRLTIVIRDSAGSVICSETIFHHGAS
jgi:hypothetical protein